jgi:hypothetical protein
MLLSNVWDAITVEACAPLLLADPTLSNVGICCVRDAAVKTIPQLVTRKR